MVGAHHKDLVGAAMGVAIILAAVVAALIVHWILFALWSRFVSRRRAKGHRSFVSRLKGPARLALPILALQIVLPATQLDGNALAICRQVIAIGIIVTMIWVVVAFLHAGEDVVLSRYDMGVRDNRHARRVTTQVRIIRRTLSFVVLLIGVAVMLMTFPRVRELGTSLLASAGIAGLILGLAARPAVENLIAGLQIAFTEPIALDDVVVVDGEWGRIEEITTTYVVVKIWDLRRLIVPFTKLLSQSFQNWTRTSAEILGTVYLYTDYTIDVAAVRAELERIVAESPNWNHQACGLVVTDAKPETLELRALVSADDSGKAWDLRCEVREKLIAFVQEKFPKSLPKVRAEIREPSPRTEDPPPQGESPTEAPPPAG